MMSSKQIYIIGIIALVLAGCSRGDADDGAADTDGRVPVQFESAMSGYSTRSHVDDDEALWGVGFGVFAYYTGSSSWTAAGASATPNFMYNQQVTYSSDNWTYTPVKYWPNDNQRADLDGSTGSQEHSYVSFFAYAPYNGDGISLSGNTDSGAPIITYTWGADSDLLYAKQTDCYKTMTEGYGTTTGRVPFRFKHALARVDFKVRRKQATGSAITLTSLGITSSDAYKTGKFNLGTNIWSDECTDGEITPLDYKTPSPSINITGHLESNAHLVGSSVMIPGDVTFTYDIDYKVGSTVYTPDAAAMSAITLEMGKKYTIMFVIDGDVIESYVLREREAEQW